MLNFRSPLTSTAKKWCQIDVLTLCYDVIATLPWTIWRCFVVVVNCIVVNYGNGADRGSHICASLHLCIWSRWNLWHSRSDLVIPYLHIEQSFKHRFYDWWGKIILVVLNKSTSFNAFDKPYHKVRLFKKKIIDFYW